VRKAFDRRVVPDVVLELVRTCQRTAPCHLAGGAALSGAYLAHRLSGDIDLFCHDREATRELARQLPALADELGLSFQPQRDSGGHIRGSVAFSHGVVEVDVVHEALPDLEPPPPPIEDVVVESLLDLRASKLTCLLSRSEPRDLVDLLFLERAGFRPEADLESALRKDAGIDPGVLAWLLRSFPVEPMPVMLEPLHPDELRAYRDDLAERFRSLATTPG
jgi:hypothetical protein